MPSNQPKATARHAVKATRCRAQKAAAYYYQNARVVLLGVVSEAALTRLLTLENQQEWRSRVRLGGLLLIIDYGLRNATKGVFSMSRDLSRSYVSSISRPRHEHTVCEALPLLTYLGILKVVRRSVNCHIKASAVYSFTEQYAATETTLEVALTPKLASKRREATERREVQLNRKYPFRKPLQDDLRSLTLAETAKPVVRQLLTSKRNATLNLLGAISGDEYSVRVTERGQIWSPINSCPRELREHLLIKAEPLVHCDISHCHWCLLPRLLSDRIEYQRQHGGGRISVALLEAEQQNLTRALSSGDFYARWCSRPDDDAERTRIKHAMLVLLNSKTEICRAQSLYRAIAAQFPITFSILEDLKCGDHRNISKLLHRWTSDATNTALRQLQKRGIPAIPVIDAILVPRSHRSLCCRLLGREVFIVSRGVCCKVDGIRFNESPRVSKSRESAPRQASRARN
jgi:hypothetical protein